jgi:hypothetical protein
LSVKLGATAAEVIFFLALGEVMLPPARCLSMADRSAKQEQ